jgi:DNA-binding transcriptional LysR family regulator
VLPSRGHSLRKLIERIASNENTELNVSIDADGLTILKELVRRGIGSTILPLPSVHREVNDGTICAKPITDPPITRKLLLALPADRPSTNASLKASEILRLQVKQIVESGIWSGKLLMSQEM